MRDMDTFAIMEEIALRGIGRRLTSTRLTSQQMSYVNERPPEVNPGVEK